MNVRLFYRPLSIIILGLFTFSFLQAQKGNLSLTLEEIVQGGFYQRSAGTNFKPAEDGACYTTLSKDRKQIVEYRFDSGKKVRTLLDLTTLGSSEVEKIEDYLIAPGGNDILVFTEIEPIYRRSWQAYAYRYDIRRKHLSPLSPIREKVMIPTFSPDGRMVAFVRDNNIFIAKFDYDSEVAVTTDGEFNKIINGATDWVYEEELRTTKLLSWSPDAKYLAYARFDESAIPEYGFQLYSERNDIPFSYMYKYPFAGESNSKVSIHLYNVENKISKAVKLPVDTETYYPRLEFTPQGSLAVFTLNRHQNDFKLFSVNPGSLVPKLQLTDTDKAYVAEEWVNSLVFEERGCVMVSERNGYAQIFRFNAQGIATKCLTPGKYDVTTLYGVDKKGNVYYQAADKSPIARRVLKVSPEGKITILAGERGVNNALFSSDFSYCLNARSNREMPLRYTVIKTDQNKEVRLLEDNVALKKKLQSYRFSPAVFTTIHTDNGLELNAYLIKPSSFDPTKKYPVLMVQYSGPNSQLALDSYSIDWTQYLAEQGYIIACVDGRGTGARGSEWRKSTYLKLGIYESDDQIAAAKAIAKLPYVDSQRIAIWGWSFGGYNTLLCLCRSKDVFKAGIAIAPVTDWSFYDTIYTERFLRTPQENPSGYRDGAPLSMARNLSGKLLIMHGTADDNVHLRNTMTFVEELIQADIPFEMAIYPNKNHSIYGGNTRLHFYKRQIDFLKRSL